MPSPEILEYLESKKKKPKKVETKQLKSTNPRAQKALQQAEERRQKTARPEPTPQQEEEDISDDDLLASTDGLESGNSVSPPSVFCRLSGRSQHLTQAVHAFARRAAQDFLPRIQRKVPLKRH